MRRWQLLVLGILAGCTHGSATAVVPEASKPPPASWHMPHVPVTTAPHTGPTGAQPAPAATLTRRAARSRIPPPPRRPRLRYEACWTGAGVVTADASRAVIRRMAKRFKRCYESSLKADPAARGKMELHVRLHPDGRVKEAHGRTDNPALEHMVPCLLAVVRSERYPHMDRCDDRFVIPILFAPAP